jgi:hypothetical protein
MGGRVKRVRNLSGLAAMAFLDAMRTIWAGQSIDMGPEIRGMVDSYLNLHPTIRFSVFQLDEGNDAALFINEEVYSQDPAYVQWAVEAAQSSNPLPPPPPFSPGGTVFSSRIPPEDLEPGELIANLDISGLYPLGAEIEPDDLEPGQTEAESIPYHAAEVDPHSDPSELLVDRPEHGRIRGDEFWDDDLKIWIKPDPNLPGVSMPHEGFRRVKPEGEIDFAREVLYPSDQGSHITTPPSGEFYESAVPEFLDPDTPESDYPIVRPYRTSHFKEGVFYAGRGGSRFDEGQPYSATWVDWGPDDPRTPEWARDEYAYNREHKDDPGWGEGYLLSPKRPPFQGIEMEEEIAGRPWEWGDAVWFSGDGGVWFQEGELAYDDYKKFAMETHGWLPTVSSSDTPHDFHAIERGYMLAPWGPGTPLYEWERELLKFKSGILPSGEGGFPSATDEPMEEGERWGTGTPPEWFFDLLKKQFEEKAQEEIEKIQDEMKSGLHTEEEGKEIIAKIKANLLTDDEIELLKTERGWEESEHEIPEESLFPGLYRREREWYGTVPEKVPTAEEMEVIYSKSLPDTYWKDYAAEFALPDTVAANIRRAKEEEGTVLPYVVHYSVPDPAPGSTDSIIKSRYFESEDYNEDEPHQKARLFAEWVTGGRDGNNLTKKKGVDAVVVDVDSEMVISGPYTATFSLPELREEMKLKGLMGE